MSRDRRLTTPSGQPQRITCRIRRRRTRLRVRRRATKRVRRLTSHGRPPTTASRIRLRRIRLRIRRTIAPRGQLPAATYRILPQRTQLRGRLLPHRGLPPGRASLGLLRTPVSRLRTQASRTTLRRRSMRARRSNTRVLHARHSTRPASLALKASLMLKANLTKANSRNAKTNPA
jgi:hypothetical protein